MKAIKGTRPRPRVALIGDFAAHTFRALGNLFPTIWAAENLDSLGQFVSPREIDLVIISGQIYAPMDDAGHSDYLTNAHIICFSNTFESLPGPDENSSILNNKKSTTEEYFIPELSLPFYNLLENDLGSITNAKGLPLLDVHIFRRRAYDATDDEQKKILFKGALFYDRHTGLPFATVFSRLQSNLGIAWLPNENFSILSWVELICTEWAKSDKERFPGFGDWTKDLQWMTREEEKLKLEIDRLTIEFENLKSDYQKRISETKNELTHASLLVNKSTRRLITAQGDELLEAVANSFEELGYSVTVMDKELDQVSPKKEDLRIRDPDLKDWEAIVEVRGHAKSSGQALDLLRLPKFARRYRDEVGKHPSKLIYVVNGQIELASPRERQTPFASAPDAVNEFGEQDGLIIWTLDLFKLLKLIQTEEDKAKTRKSLRESIARWPKL